MPLDPPGHSLQLVNIVSQSRYANVNVVAGSEREGWSLTGVLKVTKNLRDFLNGIGNRPARHDVYLTTYRWVDSERVASTPPILSFSVDDIGFRIFPLPETRRYCNTPVYVAKFKLDTKRQARRVSVEFRHEFSDSPRRRFFAQSISSRADLQ